MRCHTNSYTYADGAILTDIWCLGTGTVTATGDESCRFWSQIGCDLGLMGIEMVAGTTTHEHDTYVHC